MKQGRRVHYWKLRRNLFVFVGVFFLFALVYYLHLINGFTALNFGPKYIWKAEYAELNGPDISPTDPRVINKFLSRYLLSPDQNAQYNVNTSEASDPSMGQSAVIRRLFKHFNKSPGFFIECGALDGETRSNTLYLERQLGWKGLLVEADPKNYRKLVQKNRKVWMSNTCLSVKPYPTMVSFQQSENTGKIADFDVGYTHNGYADVQCFPFETMMTALNVSTIDYFSLDVEGAELDILRTIPFNKFDIKTLSVEFIHDAEGKVAIKEHMLRHGYLVHSEVTHPNWLANDFIFVKKSFLQLFTPAERNAIRRDILVQKNNFGGDIVVYIGSDNDDEASLSGGDGPFLSDFHE